jgi:hypothetical protein
MPGTQHDFTTSNRLQRLQRTSNQAHFQWICSHFCFKWLDEFNSVIRRELFRDFLFDSIWNKKLCRKL